MENLNLVSAWLSIALALIAIVLSISFFNLSRKTEKETAVSLAEIKTQSQMLRELTGSWMDRFTQYFTSERSQELNAQLLQIISQQPHIKSSIPFDKYKNEEEISNVLMHLYIILYFYCTQANIWSQLSLPSAPKFDKGNELHLIIKQVIDASFEDINKISELLSQHIDEANLEKHELGILYKETRDVWLPMTKTVADVFIDDTKITKKD